VANVERGRHGTIWPALTFFVDVDNLQCSVFFFFFFFYITGSVSLRPKSSLAYDLRGQTYYFTKVVKV